MHCMYILPAIDSVLMNMIARSIIDIPTSAVNLMKKRTLQLSEQLATYYSIILITFGDWLSFISICNAFSR